MNIFYKELKTAQKAAREGAKVILENTEKFDSPRVRSNDKGLVTAIDLAAEKAILQVLTTESDYGIISEESGISGKTSGLRWVIDPLDGTNNFARKVPLFGVSIALTDSKESLVGVINDPIHKKEYYAVKRGGAFCNGEKIKLPEFESSYLPMIFLNHGYTDLQREKHKFLTQALATDFNILKLGTTAIELCYVAAGAVDAFICVGDELWDFAAGVVIAQEAGCIFTDWQGNLWDGKTDHLLVSRPETHKILVEKIKEFQ